MIEPAARVTAGRPRAAPSTRGPPAAPRAAALARKGRSVRGDLNGFCGWTIPRLASLRYEIALGSASASAARERSRPCGRGAPPTAPPYAGRRAARTRRPLCPRLCRGWPRPPRIRATPPASAADVPSACTSSRRAGRRFEMTVGPGATDGAPDIIPAAAQPPAGRHRVRAPRHHKLRVAADHQRAVDGAGAALAEELGHRPRARAPLALDGHRAAALRLRAADRHAQVGLLGPHAGKRAPADALLPPSLCDLNAAIAQRLGLRVAGELEHPRKLRRLDALLGPALEAVVGHAVADFDLQGALRRAAARLDAARRRETGRYRSRSSGLPAQARALCASSRGTKKQRHSQPIEERRGAHSRQRAGFRARHELTLARPRFTPRPQLFVNDRRSHLRRRRCSRASSSSPRRSLTCPRARLILVRHGAVSRQRARELARRLADPRQGRRLLRQQF